MVKSIKEPPSLRAHGYLLIVEIDIRWVHEVESNFHVSTSSDIRLSYSIS
jgi:hypothetical protein